MKTFLAICTLVFSIQSIFAQGTAFTYQGRLNVGSGTASGLYDLTFTIYDAVTGGNIVGGPLTSSATTISNGLFAVALDFGAGIFNGADRWMEITVRTNGSGAFAALSPRQALTPSPYAIFARGVNAGGIVGSIPASQLAGVVAESQVPTNIARLNPLNTAQQAAAVPVINSGFITSANITFGGSGYTNAPAVTINATNGSGAVLTATISNGAVVAISIGNPGSGYPTNTTLTIDPPPSNAYQTFAGLNFFTGTNLFTSANTLTNANNTFAGNFAGNGAGLSNLNAQTLDGLSSSGFWKLSGNADANPTNGNFLGTTDNQPLEMKVNGARVARWERQTNAPVFGFVIPNIIGGFESNAVADGVGGATIAGGGGPQWYGPTPAQAVNGSFSTIGGGVGNVIDGVVSTIAGGERGTISFNAYNSFLGGGAWNSIHSPDSTIGGGRYNLIQSNGYAGFIGGGYQNTIGSNSYYSTIPGGYLNAVQSFASYATIGGGVLNTNGGQYATVPGGYLNSATAAYSFAAGTGARANHTGAFVWADSSSFTGFVSTAANQFNVRASGGVRFVTDGAGVTVDGAPIVTPLNLSNQAWLVSGNKGLSPTNGNFLGTIDNQPLEFRAYQTRALRLEPDTNNYGAPNVIGGSPANFVDPGVYGATIAGGGVFNYSSNAFEPGLGSNRVSAIWGTIGGGRRNMVAADHSFIGGGHDNFIGDFSFDSVIAGGSANTINALSGSSVIGGGGGNIISASSATVSGGGANTASGYNATIPGGYGNLASGQYSFAAGSLAQAIHNNSFVWSDGTATYPSTAANQFAVRATGGFRLNGDISLEGGYRRLELSGGNSSGFLYGSFAYFGDGVHLGYNFYADAAGNPHVIVPGGGTSRITGGYGEVVLAVGQPGFGPNQLRLHATLTGVGIRRTPSANALEVEGNASKTLAGSWLANSDARIKTDVQTVTNAIDKLAQVRLVQFRYTGDYRAQHPDIKDRTYLNVVAQEFRKVFPDDVQSSGEKLPGGGDPILQVDTYPLTIYSAAAIQELNQKLERELRAKDERLAAVERELADIKRLLITRTVAR